MRLSISQAGIGDMSAPTSPGVPLAPKSPSQQQQQHQQQQHQVTFKDVQTSPPDLPATSPDFRNHFPIMAPMMEERTPSPPLAPLTPAPAPLPPAPLPSASFPSIPSPASKGFPSSMNSTGDIVNADQTPVNADLTQSIDDPDRVVVTSATSTPYDSKEPSPVTVRTKPSSAKAIGMDSDYVVDEFALQSAVELSEDMGKDQCVVDDEDEDDEEDNIDDDDDDEIEYELSKDKTGETTAKIDSVLTPSDAIYAAATPGGDNEENAATPPDAATPADATAMPATPAEATTTVHILLDDSSKSKNENVLVRRFITKGCGCSLGPKCRPCYTGFSIENILKKRNAALGLPKNERELMVKAYLLHMRREPEHDPGL